MLERTAAGLESCGLPRILSQRTASRRNRSCRQLSTAFWQHGASAIELASLLCPTPHVHRHDHSCSTSESSEQLNLVSSAFVLDFLYPTSARSAVGQLGDNKSITWTGKRSDGAASRRSFKSAGGPSAAKLADRQAHRRVSKQEFEALVKDSHSEVSGNGHQIQNNKATSRKQSRRFQASQNGVTEATFSTSSTRADDALARDRLRIEPRVEEYILDRIRRDPRAIAQAQIEAKREIEENSQSARGNTVAISNLVQSPSSPNYDSAWSSFLHLSRPEQVRYSARLVAYLARSSEIRDYGRILAIYDSLPESDWTNQAQSGAVLSLVQADRTEDAINRLKSGLLRSGLSGGIEHLMAHGMLRKVWDAVTEPWRAHQEAIAKHGSDRVHPINTGAFQQLPDLGMCYNDLEKYSQKNVIEFDLHGTLPAAALQAFRRYRHKLALLALQQPCPASSAKEVLASLNDPVQYNRYLLRVLNSWLVQKTISKDQLGLHVSDIYRTYRKMVGVKPHHVLLDRMFDYFSAFQIEGHDLLLEDWTTHWGDFMTKRAYEKFLSRFARLGDVKAVLGLWRRFTKEYPAMMRVNRGWHSLLNVYAQTANPQAVEAEVSKMKVEYGIDPDTSSYNTLLKAYVRTDDYALVSVAFDRIRRVTTPNAWTYAHILAMAGKKGDLDRATDILAELQKKNIPIISQMALPISQTYCLNGRPNEALRALKQLAQHKVSSTESWNELLGYIALKADFTHWTEALAAMEALEVPPDGKTHQATLDILVNTNQLSEAYRYLVKLCKERKVVVTTQHFATVIRGAIRGEEWALLRAIQLRMQKHQVRMSFNICVLLAEAAHEARATSGSAERLAQDLPKLLEAVSAGIDVASLGLADIDVPSDRPASRNQSVLAALHENEDQVLPPKNDAGPLGDDIGRRAEDQHGAERSGSVETSALDRRRLREETREMGRAMRLLTEMENFETANKLMQVYLALFPEYKDPQIPLPNDIISALMTIPYNQRKFHQVYEMWQRCWDETVRVARKPQGGIYSANRYDLCRPLDSVIRSLREQSDGEGLLKLVQQVLHGGFRLSQSNWCLAIRYLAETGEMAWAMHYCEKYMMPAWRGWGNRRVKSSEKLEGNDTRALRATPDLILSLQREWVQLQGLANWHGPFSRLVKSSEERYPKLSEAFATSETETMQMMNEWNFPAYTHFRKAAKDFLVTRRASELWRMSIVLRGYLTQRWKRRTLSLPFRRRIVGRGHKSEPRAEFRNLSSDELQMLYDMVQARLKEEQQLREARGVTRSLLSKRFQLTETDDEDTAEIGKILQSGRREGPEDEQSSSAKSLHLSPLSAKLDDAHMAAVSANLEKLMRETGVLGDSSEEA